MRRALPYLFVTVLAVSVVLALGNSMSHVINYTAKSNPIVPWKNLGSITVAEATQAVDARDYSTVGDLANTKVVDVNLPTDGATWEFRFRTDADADAHVIEMWVCPDDYMTNGTEEVFTHGLTASLTGGTGDAYGAAGSSYGDSHFVQEILITDEGVLENVASVVNSGATADDQAILRVRLRGWNKLTFIATTLEGSTTLYVDGRQYSN